MAISMSKNASVAFPHGKHLPSNTNVHIGPCGLQIVFILPKCVILTKVINLGMESFIYFDFVPDTVYCFVSSNKIQIIRRVKRQSRCV